MAVPEFEKATGPGRLALTERVNDLVQLDLAARNIDTNHVQITAAGAALFGLINSIREATEKKLAEVVQSVTR